jgi:hypothetical protein
VSALCSASWLPGRLRSPRSSRPPFLFIAGLGENAPLQRAIAAAKTRR